MSNQRPYFIWDYNYNESDIKHMIDLGSEVEKRWVLTRLLESARLEDIWKYTSYQQIRTYFPTLKLKPIVRRVWMEAFKVWDCSVVTN